MARWLADPRRRAVVVLVATLLGMALTARLGMWQLSRAAQKEALQAALDQHSVLPPLDMNALPVTRDEAASQLQRPVRLQGTWMPGAAVFLDNRPMNGHAGFYVLTPLVIAPGDAVLVQRGWVPRDMQDRTRLPQLPLAAGPVQVQGRVALDPGHLFDFAGPAASGPIRQNLALADFSRELGVSLRPWTVLQTPTPDTAGDGLTRDWPLPAADVHKHYGYAFQWFGLCALMAGLYVWFQLLRPRFRRRP